MILIVGLGNPGKEFEKTRHNIGFEIINDIQKELLFPGFIKKFNGVYSKKYIFNQEVILFKPMKFMNLSGNPTQQVFNFFNIKNTDNLVVFHDDLDLEFPIIRCKTIGGHGGHNGIRDMIGIFGEKFNRIKVGIKIGLQTRPRRRWRDGPTASSVGQPTASSRSTTRRASGTPTRGRQSRRAAG